VAQPRCADGAADDGSVGGDATENEVVARGPRPWDTARRASLRGAGQSGTGARGRGRLPISPVRVARTLRLLVDQWGWAVVPGAFAEDGRCSCGDRQCPDPGRHPLADASWLAATSDPERVWDRWRSHPEAAVVLPVGWCFDILEVPARGGREALGRLEVMGHRLPPVIATAAGRLLFLVSALDRRPEDLAETGAPAPPSATVAPPVPRPAVATAGGSAAARVAAARDAAAARAAVSDPEPWPSSSSWPASAAGCRPETSIWVGGGAPDAPDVIVRRSGLLVAPLLGAEPVGVTRWLVPPSPTRHPLARMEDVLGPIVRACRDSVAGPGLGIPRSAGPRASVAGQPVGQLSAAANTGRPADVPADHRRDGGARSAEAGSASDLPAQMGPTTGPAVAPAVAARATGAATAPAAVPAVAPATEPAIAPATGPAAVPAVAARAAGAATAPAGRAAVPAVAARAAGAATAPAGRAVAPAVAARAAGAATAPAGRAVAPAVAPATEPAIAPAEPAAAPAAEPATAAAAGPATAPGVVPAVAPFVAPAAGPVALLRGPGEAPRRPDSTSRQRQHPENQEPGAAESLSAWLPEDLDRLGEPNREDRLSSQARGSLRGRPRERFARPVLGLRSGRGAGSGPGRVQPPASTGASTGLPRVD
jgi:hypothetical protein